MNNKKLDTICDDDDYDDDEEIPKDLKCFEQSKKNLD